MDGFSFRQAAQAIYAGGGGDDDLDDDIHDLDIARDDEGKADQAKSSSIYVRVVEDMVNAVYASDRHLFLETDWDIIAKFRDLPYHARYLLSRLLLRNPTWLPSSTYKKYVQEIGEGGIAAAIDALSDSPAMNHTEEAADISVINENGQQVIDLTLDDDEEEEEEEPEPIAGPSRLSEPDDFKPPDDVLILDHFARNEQSMTTEEILRCLKVDQLKVVAKETKVKYTKSNKSDLITALLRNAQDQCTLDSSSGKGKGKAHQTKLSFQSASPQKLENRLRLFALKQLGRCLKLNPDFIHLIRRMNIIFYRSTQPPTSLFLPALLTGFKKRSYPSYNYARTSWIWENRDIYLQYEQVIMLEAQIDAILDPEKNKSSRARLKTPPAPKGGDGVEEDCEPEKNKRARKVKLIFEREISPIYSNLVDGKFEKEVSIKEEEVDIFMNGGGPVERRAGMERFEPGNVYTRLMEKAASAFATLQDYEAEVDILERLLSQRYWRRGKRGAWYTRRALVQTQYLCKVDGEGEKRKKEDRQVLRLARSGLEEALRDEDTHLVYRPGLVQRLQKLEKKLRIPEPDRIVVEGELRTADDIEVGAIRVYHRSTSLTLDSKLKPLKKGKENGPRIDNFFNSERTPQFAEASTPLSKKPMKQNWWGGYKSLWKGKDGDEVSVEIVALQHYERAGYKGFHCETRILTTLFALLFWDIIFADIPGVFETPFQTAPLDIHEDCFYYSRRRLMETRLQEIRDSKAAEILTRHDDLYRPRSTWCIGVRWDLFTQIDLLEIIECLGAEPLATVCQLFCEDYRGRSSGVPDLVVWHYEDKMCRFVEVKGPGDTARDNQKLWFDALLQAGIQVDLCRVYDANKGPPLAKNSKKRAKSETDPPIIGLDHVIPTDATVISIVDRDDGMPRTPSKSRKVVEVVISTPPRKKFKSS